MSEENRKDIRMLLKKFGIQADEAIVRHLAMLPEPCALKLRCTLEDLTGYESPPSAPLQVTVEGEIRAQ